MMHLAATTVMVSVLAQAPVSTQAVRGLAASVEVTYDAKLRPKAQQGVVIPVLVRVASGSNAGVQRIEFLGSVAGSYDLRNYLEREDGKPLDGLAAMPVTVVSKLPTGHGTDLFTTDSGWFNWRAHYRELMWGAVGLWIAVPVGYGLWRLTRRKPEAPVAQVEAKPPTTEELLRAALSGESPAQMPVERKAQLELLVFRYFAERLGRPELVHGDPAEAYRVIREQDETRELIRAIERWLHAPAAADSSANASAALMELRRSKLDAGVSTNVAAAGVAS